MTTRASSRLRKLKEQYRQVVLREEVREKILRTILQDSSAQPGSANATSSSRSSRWRSLGWGAVAVGVVGCALFAWGLNRQAKLDVVVSAVRGQVFSDGAKTRLLGPHVHLAEGQRLRTSAASTVETKVGAHIVAVSADSSLMFESLKSQDLIFRLERGWVNMTVAPLGTGKRLRVVAGELSVEVVGTVFSVAREGDCSSVSVRSGRVATSHQGIAGEVRAGEERRFCPAAALATRSMPSPGEVPAARGLRDAEKKIAVEATGQAPPSAQTHEERPSLPKGRLEAAQAVPPAEAPLPRTEALSDEERLFRDASRTEGDASSRSLRLQDYLARFPNGMFAEDALFQLIRDSYAAENSAQVLQFSEQFLHRFHRGRRTSEVQLLYVQSLIEMGRPVGQSLGIVESLLSHLDSLPRSQREQATYLAILAYCGSPRPQSCRQWIDRYLERYPYGLYADQVRRSQMERGNAP